MMTLRNYQPVQGPYRRRINWKDIAISAIGHVAIALILAYAVLGMAGAFEHDEQPMTLACVTCAGGVR